ncbi:MAG TPA: O-antigen ligase family protein [Blastocatellia bacterium]
MSGSPVRDLLASAPPPLARRIDATITIGLLAALVFTALAFGGVEPWARALFELLVTGLTALWVLRTIVAGRIKLQVPAVALPLALLMVWAAVQGIPRQGPSGNFASISMDAEASRNTAVVLLFLLLYTLLCTTFFAATERIQAAVKFLIIYGAVLALFALIQGLTWNGAFYWVRPTQVHGFGPFANRDHFAGYMEMLAPLPVALLIAGVVPRDLRPLTAFAAVIMGTSIVASLSRGGILSFIIGVAFVLAASETRSDMRGRRGLKILAAAAILAGVVAGTLWIGAAPIINRAAESLNQSAGSQPDYYSRKWLWRDTWALIQKHPLTGTGAGAFETAFPAYSHGAGQYIVQQSHNDYLQLAADCGVTGAVFGAGFLVLLYRAYKRALNSGNRSLSAITLGCGGGIFALLTHSLFDFNLQILSNALLFLFLVAIIYAIGKVGAGSAEVRLQ